MTINKKNLHETASEGKHAEHKAGHQKSASHSEAGQKRSTSHTAGHNQNQQRDSEGRFQSNSEKSRSENGRVEGHKNRKSEGNDW